MSDGARFLKELGDATGLDLVRDYRPSITTPDGFTIQVDACGGFSITAPGLGATPFAWAQTMDEADRKVERERKERAFTGGAR